MHCDIYDTKSIVLVSGILYMPELYIRSGTHSGVLCPNILFILMVDDFLRIFCPQFLAEFTALYQEQGIV